MALTPYCVAFRNNIGSLIRTLMISGTIVIPTHAYGANECPATDQRGPTLAVPGKLHTVRASNGLFGASPIFNVDDDHFWSGPGPGSLQKAGITALRFPGGEVADNYDWETSSISRTTEWPKEPREVNKRKQRTDYLEFLNAAKKIGADNIFFVVNVDSAFRAPGGSDANLQKYADKAARWVAAVKESGFTVKYWEIGNEVNLGRNAITAEEYAKVLNTYATAMRKADPSIMIGAVGPFEIEESGFADTAGPTALKKIRAKGQNMYKPCGPDGKSSCSATLRDKSDSSDLVKWWPTLLENAKNSFDFAVVHQYRVAQWPKKGNNFRRTQDLDTLKDILSKAKGKEVPVAITEWNIYGDKKGLHSPMSRLLNISLYLGNHAASSVDYALYWPMRKGGTDWASLLNGDESLSSTGKVFSLLSEIVPNADVAQTLLSPSVYVLKISKNGTNHALLINKGKKSTAVAFSDFAGKSALLNSFEAEKNDNVKERSCTVRSEGKGRLQVDLQPRSVVVIRSD